MRMTIERVRVVLVAGAAVLVLIVAGFLTMAHFRAHRFLRELPARLGADIENETNGFTYSQTGVGGRTLYTLHAAKEVRRRDGKVLLHDVGIMLYGEDGRPADRIYGKDFEYDQAAGVVRAQGEVHLDLAAPAASVAGGGRVSSAGQDAKSNAASGVDPELVHVKTSGLVYQEKEGVASTAEEMEFTYRGYSGRAIGASYNAGTGMTTLERDVHVSGVGDGGPMLLTAAHAEMDKKRGLLVLRDARYVRVGERSGDGDGRQQTAAGLLRVSLRTDGTVGHAEGSDGVSLESARGTLQAPRGMVEMSEAGKPEVAHMLGGVTYRLMEAFAERSGEAAEMTAHFDPRGRAEDMTMLGGVQLRARSRTAAEADWSDRELRARTVEVRLGATGGHGSMLREAVAAGEAHLVLTEPAVKREPGAQRGGPERSEVAGDRLTATFEPSGREVQITRVEGVGHTVLERRMSDGASDRSTGDELAVRFVPQRTSAAQAQAAVHPGERTGAALGRAGRVANAVQRGSVSIRRVEAPRDGKTETVDATAHEATYDGERDRLHLAGEVTVRETARSVRADRVDLDHRSGDARASGHVEVSSTPANGGESMHVVADAGQFAHGAGTATFHGGETAHGAARAWQGGSQVEAPTLVFTQVDGGLDAFGAAGSAGAVRTILSERDGGTGRVGMAKVGVPRGRSVLRVTSGRLRYRGSERRAEFTGGVLLEDSNGSMRAAEATAYLLPDETKRAAGSGAERDMRPETVAGAHGSSSESGQDSAGTALFGTGGLDHVVATGAVVLRQPGREATGERAVYTAADGLFTLTGTPAALPTVSDGTNGTVRGTSIRFHSGDNSVVVSGDPARGATGRVRSETRIKTDQ